MSISRLVVLTAMTLAVSALVGNAAAQNHAEHYVADGFGGVHAGGGAPAIVPATPYFGFDVVADIEYVAVGTPTAIGNGVLVLDKFGGVHKGGALAAHPPAGVTPYFGFDVARAMTVRDVPPRAAGTFVHASAFVTSTTFVVLASATIRAPDDGFLVVTATSRFGCSHASEGGHGVFSIAVDGTTPPLELEPEVGIPDCDTIPLDLRSLAVTYMFPVAAGTHAVNAIGRRVSGLASLSFTDVSITVVFIDRNGNGSS